MFQFVPILIKLADWLLTQIMFLYNVNVSILNRGVLFNVSETDFITGPRERQAWHLVDETHSLFYCMDIKLFLISLKHFCVDKCGNSLWFKFNSMPPYEIRTVQSIKLDVFLTVL